MSRPFPYSYISCPCTDTSTPVQQLGYHEIDTVSNKLAKAKLEAGDEDEEERTFDPRSPRANYSLYPLEHLLYCEDCHEIRCPRCVLDEIVCWFCPSCLFDVASSAVKTEGNRCTRSCFSCPICVTPLSVTNLDSPGSKDYEKGIGPFALTCPYCSWTTLEIGLKFERANNISGQIAAWLDQPDRMAEKIRLEKVKAGEIPKEERFDGLFTRENRFKALKSFYAEQLAADNSASSPLDLSGAYGYGSPGALTRIMGLYSGVTGYGNKRKKTKSGIMREASLREGLKLLDPEDHVVEKLKTEGWDGTATTFQRMEQKNPARFVSDLAPVPVLLRTKRSKRCKTCRHILVKPESKVQTTRFKIRLVAMNYIPTITVRQLRATLTDYNALPPLKPIQFLVTFTNPLFDPVRITLATPSHTPGRFTSKVTILCPQFDIGANTDVWDEALGTGGKEKRRTKAESSEGQAEAGKIWEKGRNWTSVVLEVVPANLDPVPQIFSSAGDSGRALEPARIEEDDDALEIPLFVRIEYETDAAADEGDASGGSGAGKEKVKRELAYWCVLGVGRIARIGHAL